MYLHGFKTKFRMEYALNLIGLMVNVFLNSNKALHFCNVYFFS